LWVADPVAHDRVDGQPTKMYNAGEALTVPAG